MGLYSIHIAVFLFGFSGLFGKFLLISPILIVFGRTFFAAAALLPLIFYITATGRTLYISFCPQQSMKLRFSYPEFHIKTPFKKENPFKKKVLLLYMLQGALLAVHWCSFFYSIQISTVAVGLLTFSTFPLFVTFMEPIFFKEKLIFSDIAAAFAVFAGLVLVLPGFDFSRAPVKGAFWGIFSGFTFAMLAIANRKNVEKESPLVVAFSQNFFAATALLPAIIYLSPDMPGRTDILLLAGLGIICTALAHTLFIKSLIHIKARTAGIITALEPLYGIILAFFILNETPGLKTVAGGILIITATTIAMSLHKKNS
ncbi:MAG: DMT family transporter [Thermodesulfobacteriota bacterium]|nr:DMT family transporter [Thermodesulfobacteriota bacterium]